MIVDDLEKCRKELIQARIDITEAITMIMSLEGSISKGLSIEMERLDAVYKLLEEAAMTTAGVGAEFYTGE